MSERFSVMRSHVPVKCKEQKATPMDGAPSEPSKALPQKSTVLTSRVPGSPLDEWLAFDLTSRRAILDKQVCAVLHNSDMFWHLALHAVAVGGFERC